MRVNRILRCTNPIIEPIVTRHCSRCKYFNLDTERCRKFQHTNVITGNLEYVPAEICRKDEKKCGLSAIYYDESPLPYKPKENEILIRVNNNKTTYVSKTCCYLIIIGGIIYYFILPIGILGIGCFCIGYYIIVK
jgi:hypothetical protein